MKSNTLFLDCIVLISLHLTFMISCDLLAGSDWYKHKKNEKFGLPVQLLYAHKCNFPIHFNVNPIVGLYIHYDYTLLIVNNNRNYTTSIRYHIHISCVFRFILFEYCFANKCQCIIERKRIDNKI